MVILLMYISLHCTYSHIALEIHLKRAYLRVLGFFSSTKGLLIGIALTINVLLEYTYSFPFLKKIVNADVFVHI